MAKIAAVTVQDAARERGCTLKYIYDLLYAGRIPGAQKVGKRWLIPARWLREDADGKR